MKEMIRMKFHFCTFLLSHTGSAFHRWIFFLLFLLLSGLPDLYAQQASDYTIQANIIYRFTKYIDWPAGKKTGDFIIGTVGDSPLVDELIEFTANKTVGNQKIVIRKFSSLSETFNCHILFICEDKSYTLKKIALLTAGLPILLVSESEGLARKGSCINFIIVSDRLKLEINKTYITQRNLNIASELLQLGNTIK